MKKSITTALFLLFTVGIFAQGNLVLVGGGQIFSTPNSWNSAPYNWAVDHAANKKVAILTTGLDPSALASYFSNNTNAVAVDTFLINTVAKTNDAALAAIIAQHDLIFLYGDNPKDFQDIYPSSVLFNTIEQVFYSGGVVCGEGASASILGSVYFTAENGNITSPEALINRSDTRITLQSNIFDFQWGYLVDNNFANEANMGRLMTFLSRWAETVGDTLLGMGIDNQTAIVVDTNRIGRVMGTGAVRIYLTSPASGFENRDVLHVDSVNVIQLLDGYEFDFKTATFTDTMPNDATPAINGEEGNYDLFMSASDSVQLNTGMMVTFGYTGGGQNDSIIIVSGANTLLAQEYVAKFQQFGFNNITIRQALAMFKDDPVYKTSFENNNRFFFVGNDYADLMGYLGNGVAGKALEEAISSTGVVNAFVGRNAQFACPEVVEGYNIPGASYSGQMLTKPGIGLLKTTLVMPETFMDMAMYENTATAIPFFLTDKKYKWGHWIFGNQFIHYFPNAGKPYITSSGDGVVMTLTNLGTRADKAKKTADGTGNTYRQIAGFEQMTFSVWSDDDTLRVGDSVIGVGMGELQKQDEKFNLFPNPVNENLLVETHQIVQRISVIDQNGRQVMQIKPDATRSSIDVSGLHPGMYIVQVVHFDGNRMQREIIKL